MDESISDKAFGRMSAAQAGFDRAMLAADRAQSRFAEVNEHLEQMRRELVQVTVELDRLRRLRRP